MLIRSDAVEQKCCSEVLLRRVPENTVDQIRSVGQTCCSEVSIRSVVQKRRSKVSLRSVGQKCCSEVSNRTVARKFRSEVCSMDDEQCGSEVLIRSVAPSEVLRRSVALKYRSEVWIRSIDQKCCSELSIVVSISSVESAVL